MGDETVAPGTEVLAWFLRQPTVPWHKFTALRPDFLVISSPKTGSTWLATNLRRHPAVFVPDIKEVKYFSSYFKWLDLNWYLDQFAPGAGRVKGEASPSYAILPAERIRLVHRLVPDVKLIYLMREPVARAWSHAKHNYSYREANFAAGAGPFETVTEAQWHENFVHEWPLASGDYLGQLRRWLSVFPREQLYLGFFESIVTRPQALLRDVFTFLGVTADVDYSALPVEEQILPGPPGELSPALRHFLQELLRERTRELAPFLWERFGLRLPPEWEASLVPSGGPAAKAGPVSAPPGVPAAFRHEFDDRYLARVLEQEEAFPSSPTPVLEGYRGYDIVYYRGRLYATDQALGRPRVNEIAEAELRDYQGAGTCLTAPSLEELKERVDEHVFGRLQSGLRAAGEHISRLERNLEQAVNDVRRLEEALRGVQADVARPSPWYAAVARLFRKA